MGYLLRACIWYKPPMLQPDCGRPCCCICTGHRCQVRGSLLNEEGRISKRRNNNIVSGSVPFTLPSSSRKFSVGKRESPASAFEQFWGGRSPAPSQLAGFKKLSVGMVLFSDMFGRDQSGCYHVSTNFRETYSGFTNLLVEKHSYLLEENETCGGKFNNSIEGSLATEPRSAVPLLFLLQPSCCDSWKKMHHVDEKHSQFTDPLLGRH